MSIFFKYLYQIVVAFTTLGVLSLSNLAHADSRSSYTSLKLDDCKRNNNVSYLLATCPSKAGYQIEVLGGDLRFSANLNYKQHKVRYEPLRPFEAGEVAEWRYRQKNGEKQYHALIYRMRIAQLDNEDNGITFLPQSQDKHELVVIRLAKEQSCVIGVVPQGENMNTKAREIADSPKMSCVETSF